MAAASPQDELAKLKEIFLCTLNHEIRTPLAGMIGMTDLLLETRLDDEQRDYLNAARLCAENLFEILTEALEYSALAAGQFVLDDTEFCLREMLDAAVSQHRPKAEAKGLTLALSIDAALPETILGDPLRARQLLGYLIGNAVKFTPAGAVDVAARLENNSLLVEIQDTGIGIPADRLEAMFESFKQGEQGMTRPYPGLGLGLALARKLAALMGGSIHAESAPGRGSVFRARLPLRRPPREEPPIESPPASDPPAILVVDDNPVGLRIIRHMLERRRVSVDCAHSGFDALKAAQARRYDAVLMDLQMPEMDGLTAAMELRKIPGYAAVPILALTANYSDETREKCRALGMQSYIAKPVESDSLWAALARYLSR